MEWIEKPTQESLYWIVELPSEECARKISSRSISLRWCIELWARSKTQDMLHVNLRNSITNNPNTWHSATDNTACACPRELMEPYFIKEKTFKITVETFCKHFSLSEKVKKIENFIYLPMEGSIRLKNPDTELIYLEDYGSDPNTTKDDPCDVFFGRVISEGQRQLIKKLSLKTRKFIGNTSMDAQLSVLMANQVQISHGDIVIDPFVGSGSLLVAAAEFGGYVWGTDIDFLMLHGKTRPTRVNQKERQNDESIRANMRQYKTESQYLDVLVSDFSLPLWRDGMRFDAIITDPPYGIREATEKIGIEKENYSLTPEQMQNHYPAKIDYGLNHIFSDLLSFAAQYLVLGKRLVCWFPIYREDYTEDMIPTHSCLKLVANSEQILSKYISRRLLTYEKTSEPCDVSIDTYCLNDVRDTNSITPDREVNFTSDFREKYFNPGDLTQADKKEQKANEKIRAKMQKAMRLEKELKEKIRISEVNQLR